MTVIEKWRSRARYELFTSSQSSGNLRLYERLGYIRFKQLELSDKLRLVYLEKNNPGRL